MALKINTPAPDFVLPSTDGSDFHLYTSMKDKPCILYFYPKDFTPGCTLEACDFRDNFTFFKEVEIDVLGISRDSMDTHLKFQKAHQLPFELLSDSKGEVSKLYDALLPLIGINRRITYLLDHKLHIKAVYNNLFAYRNHIREMISEVKKMKV